MILAMRNGIRRDTARAILILSALLALSAVDKEFLQCIR